MRRAAPSVPVFRFAHGADLVSSPYRAERPGDDMRSDPYGRLEVRRPLLVTGTQRRAGERSGAGRRES
jgi:hypothetical protein